MTDFTLKKMSRNDLVRSLEEAEKHSPGSDVVIAFRDGPQMSVVKCCDDGRAACLCPFERGSPAIGMAGLFGSSVREMGLSDVLSALRESGRDEVRIGWPGSDARSAVGKAIAVRSEGASTVVLVPVPEDIDDVSSEVREIVSKRCPEAAKGTECGKCPRLGSCAHLGIADYEVRKRRGALG